MRLRNVFVVALAIAACGDGPTLPPIVPDEVRNAPSNIALGNLTIGIIGISYREYARGAPVGDTRWIVRIHALPGFTPPDIEPTRIWYIVDGRGGSVPVAESNLVQDGNDFYLDIRGSGATFLAGARADIALTFRDPAGMERHLRDPDVPVQRYERLE